MKKWWWLGLMLSGLGTAYNMLCGFLEGAFGSQQALKSYRSMAMLCGTGLLFCLIMLLTSKSEPK